MKEYADYYFRKAKAENYPARSVYKLQEIDSRFHLFKKGQKVLDLGAAPGSWTLWAAQKIGPGGLALACDLREAGVSFPPQVIFRREDALAPSDAFARELAELGPFDLVISDMAPATSGSKFTDQARSLELALKAFEMATEYLKKGGHFIVKIFMGPDTGEVLEPMRQMFGGVKTFKPKSSRSESKETFFIGIGCKAGKAPIQS